MKNDATTLRIYSDDWLTPIPIDRYFDASRPLEVDVGSGKGRFLLARAAANPDVNFLGVDRMLQRIRKVDRKAQRLKLANVRLLRMEAYYAVTYLIPPASVSTYYIFFPDPWPKKRHVRHRLFNEPFMNAIWRTLKPGGFLYFSTDHLPYFEAVAALLRADPRFRETEPFIPSETERTDFELYFVQHTPIGRFGIRKPA